LCVRDHKLIGISMEKPLAMIIEDERDIAALFRHVLDITGYRTEIVMHGSDALKRLELIRPDIILLDLNLPGVSGAKILEEIRSNDRLMNVPVVVITGYSQAADSLPVEPDLVLMKPVNMDQLSNLVQRLQTTHGSLKELPWDEVTHLYNRSFFIVRLAYSLERAKQVNSDRFGILFIDLAPFELLRGRMYEDKLNAFLHTTALHLKTLLRPTDTISRYAENLFLVLIEDVSRVDIPSKIAARVELDFGNYLASNRATSGLRAYVGVILCEPGYENAEQIMSDIDLARLLAKKEEKYVLFDKGTLAIHRNSVSK
jgi:diguanylate cyclase (GGDEF)-like protein